MLITVDCSDIDAIKHDLAVYVADQLGAIPAIKLHEFVISSIDDNDTLDCKITSSAIREYLDSIGESHNFAILAEGDRVNIHSINGKSIVRPTTPRSEMFSCPHCGFVTSYEVEYNAHKKIHYL